MIGPHFTDQSFGAGCVRRKIGNWLNYPVAGAKGVYESIAAAMTATRMAKETHVCETNALTCKVGDQDSRELTYILAPSDHPELWVRLTLVDGNKVDPQLQPDGSLLYRNAVDGVDVQLLTAPGRLKESLIVNDRKVTALRWKVEQSPLLTMRVDGNVTVWSDRNGKAVMETRAPWGHDSSKTALTLDGTQPLRASLTEDHGDLVLTLDATDLDKATLPAVYDPTAVISGATAIDDTHVYTLLGRADWNMGSQNVTYVGKWGDGTPIHTLFRFDQTQIPVGLITALRLKFYQSTDRGANTLSKAYLIKDGNTWIEGLLSGGLETGLGCTWNHASHLPGQDWLGGHSGCGVSGVDYDSDASPPTHDNQGAVGWNTLELPPAWATAWRDGARVNNGFVLIPDGFPANNYVTYYTTDNVANKPYFEIDHTVGSGARFKHLLGTR